MNFLKPIIGLGVLYFATLPAYAAITNADVNVALRDHGFVGITVKKNDNKFVAKATKDGVVWDLAFDAQTGQQITSDPVTEGDPSPTETEPHDEPALGLGEGSGSETSGATDEGDQDSDAEIDETIEEIGSEIDENLSNNNGRDDDGAGAADPPAPGDGNGNGIVDNGDV